MRVNQLVFTVFCFGALGAQAQILSTAIDPFYSQGAYSLSKAGATVASEINYDSLHVNPAAPSFSTQYFAGASYLNEGNSIGGSVIDTRSGKIGGGVTYLRRNFKSNAPKDAALGAFPRYEEQAAVSLFSKSNEKIAFGVTGRYAYRRSYLTGVKSGTSWNGDAGVLYKITPELRVGASAMNLLGDDLGVTLTHYNLGAEYRHNSLAFSGQMSLFKEPSSGSGLALPEKGGLLYAFSAEYTYQEQFSLCAGYRENQAWQLKYLTAGLGFKNEKISLNYAFVRLHGGEAKLENRNYHSAALGMFF